MRLSRTDVVPVLAIVAGGAVGLLTSALVLLAGSDYVSSDLVAAPAATAEASASQPLVYIDGVRIRNDSGTPPLEGWLRGEDIFTASAVRSALDQWFEMTGTSPALIDGVQGIEIVSGHRAVTLYGDEASGGVILVSLKR